MTNDVQKKENVHGEYWLQYLLGELQYERMYCTGFPVESKIPAPHVGCLEELFIMMIFYMTSI